MTRRYTIPGETPAPAPTRVRESAMLVSLLGAVQLAGALLPTI